MEWTIVGMVKPEVDRIWRKLFAGKGKADLDKTKVNLSAANRQQVSQVTFCVE
jgi:hypothetical protein